MVDLARHVWSALALALAVVACASPPAGDGDGVDAAGEPAPPAPPGGGALAPPGLRAAHVATRQAEGAREPRFHVVRDRGGLRTAAHRGLAARFDAGGVELSLDDGAGGRLETAAVRCGGRALPAPGGALAIDPAAANRLARGGGATTEWYVNGPLGLEHGFELEPSGCATTLTVELATPGFTPSLVGDHVRLTSADGARALRYGDLFAHDADGQPLPASFAVAGGRVTIAVDVAAARGRITIDPLIYVELQRVGPTVDGDGEAGDQYGVRVALSGDTAIVGARFDAVRGVAQGSAYVYVRSAGGWTLQQKLVAADGAASDQFGYMVTLDGDTAAVSAWSALGGRGAIYVFARSGTTWTQQQKLVASDGAAGDGFGIGLALAGDTLVAGAYTDDTTFPDTGSAYVFTRSGGVWTEAQKLTAGDRAAGDQLGIRVALDGDTIVAGAQQDDAAVASQGSAYVFVRSGGAWTEQARLTASDGATNDYFGEAVAVAGDTVIVGAYLADVAGRVDQGAAYVYVRTGTSWAQTQKLLATDGSADSQFGVSAVIVGDRALVGAYRHDLPGAPQAGAAYVFARSGGVWGQQQRLTAGDPGVNDSFGLHFALAGDTVLVGAYQDDVGFNVDQGSVYTFAFDGTSWTPQQPLTSGDGGINDQFGHAVAMAGDTAIVGAYLDDIGGNLDQGAAYVYLRSGSTWSLQQRLTAADGATNDGFGVSVAIAGDTAIVGAFADDVGAATNQGSAYVFVRDGAVWTQQARLVANDGLANDQLGTGVALDGDVALVGAFLDDGPAGADQGSVYAFRRTGAAWGPPQKLVAATAAAGDRFGYSVALSGNTALVGAYLDDVTVTDQGAAWVYVWDGASWTSQAQLVAGDAASVGTAAHFGISVAVSADTAVVGAYLANAPSTDQGAAYVFVRAGTTWTQQQRLTASDGLGSDQFGVSVAVAGDLALVGAWLDDTAPAANRGAEYVFLRNGAVWTQQAKVVASDGDVGDQFGYASVAITGPTAGGYLTALGAPIADGRPPLGNASEGAVYFGSLEPPGPCTGLAAGTTCRAAAGPCDVAEVCDGVSGGCPADGFAAAGTACGDGGDTACDDPDTCDGSGACAANHEPATTICRADAGDCDVAETCDGAGGCPADALVDLAPPTLECPVATRECTSPDGAAVDLAAGATDVCDPAVTASCPTSGATLALGAHYPVCSATDASGNAVSCTGRITVVDTTAPAIACPAPIELECTSAAGAVVGFAADAVDVCDPAALAACAGSGDTFAVGVHAATCTATDASGNTASCPVSITVADTTPPSFDPATVADVVVDGVCGGGPIALTPPVATDRCSPAVAVTCAPVAADSFGHNPVACTATDDAGLTATATLDVEVRCVGGCPGLADCGCSVPDSDHDGSKDCADGCPADAGKTAAGICGCGTADVDADGDEVVDCLEAALIIDGRRSHVYFEQGRGVFASFEGRLELTGGLLAPDLRDGASGPGQIAVAIEGQSVHAGEVSYGVADGAEPADNRERWTWREGVGERATVRWKDSEKYVSSRAPGFPSLSAPDNLGRLVSRFVHADETRLRFRWTERTELPLTIAIDGVPVLTVSRDPSDLCEDGAPAAGGATLTCLDGYAVASTYAVHPILRDDDGEARRVIDVDYTGDRLGDGNLVAWYADGDPADGLSALRHAHTAIDDGTGSSVWYNAGGRFQVVVPITGLVEPVVACPSAELALQFGDASTAAVVEGASTWNGYRVERQHNGRSGSRRRSWTHWRAREAGEDCELDDDTCEED